ncbi:MAG: VCBS repeat-containing protein, partial [Kitasatospora sp.]|nr:VCBS repeat-containing protein [Kitasatospora sp.]
NGVALNGKGAVQWTADPKAPAAAVDGKLHGAVLVNGVFASPDIPYADGHAVVFTWIVRSDPTTDGDLSTASPNTISEIRDGRTGEVLHQLKGGSPWSHGNYFADADTKSLYRASLGTLNTMGADGDDSKISFVAPMRNLQFINGPGGRKLLAGGVSGGINTYDLTSLSGGAFKSGNGMANLMGGQNYLAADLDGDGTDEMISLNYDNHGVNRMAQQLGGGVLSLDDAIHQMSTFKLS